MSRRASPAWTVESVQTAQRSLSPDAPVRLGVITNPFSRTNARSRLHDRLIPSAVQSPEDALTTHTVAEFDAALAQLIFQRGANVIGLNGGDGTLHLGVNRLIALQREVAVQTRRTFPLPRLLFLNGGTLNIVSRATGTQGNPVRTVREFMRRWGARRLGEVPVRRVRLLAVRTTTAHRGASPDVAPPRYGFIFGTEVVANALEMYTMFGEGYLGLARFLAEVGVGYAVGTQLWRDHGWKLDPTGRPLVVDGQEHRRNLGAVACTIELSLVKGVLTALRPPDDGSGFAVRLLAETHPGRVIRSIPQLMLGRAADGVVDVPDAHSLVASGCYTLDGELFLDRSPEGARRRLEVSPAGITLDAVRVTG